MPSIPRVAFISCGGSISALGRNSLDLIDYADGCDFLTTRQLLERYPEIATIVDVVHVEYAKVSSAAIKVADWIALRKLIDDLAVADPEIRGFVIAHGTATLEETAYFLNLTLKAPVPVVLVGAQRPPSALGSDAGMNLFNAFRTVISRSAIGLGVLVVMNDEIHHSRDVAKTSTLRLQTFRSVDFGMLGQVDGDGVRFYRACASPFDPQAAFVVDDPSTLPRVDISYSHVDADGTAINAFVSAGAAGIVAAGFAPGLMTPGEMDAAKTAINRGVVVVQCSRAGSGRVAKRRRLEELGLVTADNLNPQKARILLMLALTRSKNIAEIQYCFDRY
jgi:L-asparaginase